MAVHTCSSLSTWIVLALLFYRSCYSYNLVSKHSGTVLGGNIQYYTISVSEILILGLVSDSGDADIFVSSATSTPGSDDYEYCSVSTGLEIVVVPPRLSSSSRVTVGIQGHIRYDSSSYRLFVLNPSKTDYQDNQIWEFDPETGHKVLIIDIDTLWLANEPHLNRIMNNLAYGNNGALDEGAENNEGKSKTQRPLKTVRDWMLWLAAVVLRILIEVVG